jgi:hypothetical protein
MKILSKVDLNVSGSSMARRTLRLAAIDVLAIISMSLASQAWAGDWKTVANSATAIPGSSGKLFSSFGQPSLNNKCAIAFRGRSSGGGEPARGVYTGSGCKVVPLQVGAAQGGIVPEPNNLAATFNEFPAFPRLDLRNNLLVTRGQSKPVWEYTLPDGSDTRVGTSGVYAGLLGDSLRTGASLLGAVPNFGYFAVPGHPGLRFDQFPGAPAVFDGNKVAFKGNFTDGSTSKTGVYVRDIYSNGGTSPGIRIADSDTLIPGTSTQFGSTAPPSAADSAVVFAGFDNEDAPTVGGIYKAVAPAYAIQPLVTIGQPSPDSPELAFTKYGEALSFDGQSVGFWAALGNSTRTVRVHCPTDGNTAVIAACVEQCPSTDTGGNYCDQQVPVEQGLYVRRPNGELTLVARAGESQPFKDFLFWTFSGRPPGVGESDAEDFEPPRWRSSSFFTIFKNASAFKAIRSDDATGIFVKPSLKKPISAILLIGSDASLVDASAPVGAAVSAVGLERDGLRRCVLAVNASFLNTDTSASWAGVYSRTNICRLR